MREDDSSLSRTNPQNPTNHPISGLFIHANTRDKRIIWLLDSGSEINLISMLTFQQLGLSLGDSSRVEKVVGLNATSLVSEIILSLEFDNGHQSLIHIYVAETTARVAVLGRPFLKDNDVVIGHRRDVVLVKNIPIRSVLTREEAFHSTATSTPAMNNIYCLFARSDQVLPPNSITKVDVITDANLELSQLKLVKSYNDGDNLHRAPSSWSIQSSSMEMVNPNSHPIKISRGRLLARGRRCDDEFTNITVTGTSYIRSSRRCRTPSPARIFDQLKPQISNESSPATREKMLESINHFSDIFITDVSQLTPSEYHLLGYALNLGHGQYINRRIADLIMSIRSSLIMFAKT